MDWRLLLRLIPALTIATLLCVAFGLRGSSWYAQPTAAVPAVAGALVAVFASRRRPLRQLVVTFFGAWAVALSLSYAVVVLFVYAYNGELGAGAFRGLGGYAVRALGIGGAVGAATLFLAGSVANAFRSRTAA